MYGVKSSFSWLSTASHAVAGSCGDASIMLHSPHSGISGGVMFSQLAPPSRVMWTRPSSEPAQIRPGVIGDSEIVKMVA